MATRMFLFYRVEREGASNMIRRTEQIVEVPATGSPADDRVVACKQYYSDRAPVAIPNLVIAELKNARSVPDVYHVSPRTEPRIVDGYGALAYSSGTMKEASELGLAPGVFPDQLKAYGRTFLRGQANYSKTRELLSIDYVCGTEVLIILND